MPVYEYQCKACHKDFEYQQRMSDPDKTVCEACGGELDRLISRTAFALKGGGWYKDLYASAKPEAKSADASATPAASSDASASKPDTSSGSAPSGTSGSSGGSSSGTPSSGSSGGSSSGGGSSSTAAAARAE